MYPNQQYEHYKYDAAELQKKARRQNQARREHEKSQARNQGRRR